MDKGDDSDQFHHLRTLNKLSHKISKPTRRQPELPPLHAPTPDPHAPPQGPQHQPPVYNISKNDFREVVQKLTGSPAHDLHPTSSLSPPPPPPPRPSSRLHRIRPPPLVQLSPRPPPMLTPMAPQNPNPAPVGPTYRPPPMSPLPPFPTVHAAAESPISAYMRFLQSSTMVPPLLPPSPLAFGCLSPLFSPSGLSGLPPLPISPVPSPGKRAN